jgi:intein-encoded DNA endonuclease-like protein
MKEYCKLPYNKLSQEIKDLIIKKYYEQKELEFIELADLLKVSERSIGRVLKEAGINNKRKNRYNLNENYFSSIDNQNKAYILGLLYADGFVGDSHFNNIVLSMKDKELVELVGKKIEFTGEVRKCKKGGFENSTEGYVLNFSSEKMANNLREWGMFPNKSLVLNELPKIKEELYRHFIRGYFDGDGSIVLSQHSSYHKVGGQIKKYVYPSYYFMLLGTKEFLLMIVDKMNLQYFRIDDTKTDAIKSLRVNAKCVFNSIFSYMYDDAEMYLQRKYDKWLQIKSAFMM